MVSSTLRPHFTPGKEPVPIVQEAGWAPGPVWTGGKSIPERSARSQSLYRLSYPAHYIYIYVCVYIYIYIYIYITWGVRVTFCYKNPTMHSICIVVDLHIPVNSIKPLCCHANARMHALCTVIEQQYISYCCQQ